ncbi:MAG: hypothetical protein AAGD33_24000, partial [Actinomycetota bacterium]
VARRRRGRWGALHDDVLALLDLIPEDRRPAVPTAPAIADAVGRELGPEEASIAWRVAEQLDRVVADPTFDGNDDQVYAEAQRDVSTIRRRLAELSRTASS